jgi:hypothetical protein
LEIQKIEILIRKCIPTPQKINSITNRLQTPEEVEKYFPGFLAFTDSTEQQHIPRHKSTEKRKIFYSGKKKRHTIKNQLVVTIVVLSFIKPPIKKERRYDYSIYKNNHSVIPNQVVAVADL